MQSAPTEAKIANGNGNGQNFTFALTILTSLFFLWGFITCLNDILIPHLKALFSLTYTQAMLIQFCFFTAYFVVSLPAGIIIEKTGYKKGIVIGLITAGLGCLTFYPAAALASYPVFLVGLFILASGITLLQVAANPYVTILGKPETASSRLNLTQAFNSLGTTIAPIFGSYFILSAAVKTTEELKKLNGQELTAYKLAQAASVQVPYLGITAALFIIAAIFAIIKLPEIEAPSSEHGKKEEKKGKSSSNHNAWSYLHLILGAVGIFVYVGAEVSIGSFLVNYLGQPYIANLTPEIAGKMVAFYWGGAMVGRFIGSAIQMKVDPGKYLGINAIIAAILVLTSMLTFGKIAMWTILAIGLFNSIMFPTIFSLSIKDLGKHTGQGSGILCMAIVGGALIPFVQGMLADKIGIHHAFILPIFCYLFIAYFGFAGHKPKLLKGE
ncbi:MAG: L-fucose:H+ symporter permease [Firmicutes bacterium]|nr:L-fucose:H+ symporter permease [Bacillota bacterium]